MSYRKERNAVHFSEKRSYQEVVLRGVLRICSHHVKVASSQGKLNWPQT